MIARVGPFHIFRRKITGVVAPFSQTMDPPRFELPPGPSYILRRLLSWKTISYVAFVGCIRVGGETLGVHLPLWAILSSSTVAFPAIIYARTEFQYWKDKRKAKSLGARLAPKVPSKWPAGLDLIAVLINEFKTGYIGESYDLCVL